MPPRLPQQVEGSVAVMVHTVRCGRDLLICEPAEAVRTRFPDMAACRAAIGAVAGGSAVMRVDDQGATMARCRYDPGLVRRRGQSMETPARMPGW
jgi:hypothetical protein